MGIKSLQSFLEKMAERGIRKRHLRTYKNKTLVIDLSIFLYRILHNNPDNYLYGIINLIAKFKRFSIDVIFVFDGKPPREKHDTLIKRRKSKNQIVDRIKLIKDHIKTLKTIKKLQSAECSHNIDNIMSNKLDTVGNGTEGVENTNNIDDSDRSSDNLPIDVNQVGNQMVSLESQNNIEEKYKVFKAGLSDLNISQLKRKMKKLKSKNVYISKDHIINIKRLFDLMHIKYVHMDNEEADKVCCYLVKIGKAYACVSNDMDMLPFGCDRVIRDLNFYKCNNITEYNLSKILKILKLSSNKFIDICIMSGCDYNDKIIGLKPFQNYNYIKQFNTLENTIEHIDEINTREPKVVRLPKKFDYQKSREIFHKPINGDECFIHNESVQNISPKLRKTSSSSSQDSMLISSIDSDTRDQLLSHLLDENITNEVEIPNGIEIPNGVVIENGTNFDRNYYELNQKQFRYSTNTYNKYQYKQQIQNGFSSEVNDVVKFVKTKCRDTKLRQISSKIKMIFKNNSTRTNHYFRKIEVASYLNI